MKYVFIIEDSWQSLRSTVDEHRLQIIHAASLRLRNVENRLDEFHFATVKNWLDIQTETSRLERFK